MSQQVPFDNSGVPLGSGMVAAGGGYADAAPGYVPQNVSVAGQDRYGGGGGYWQPPQGPQTFARNRVPMIDPIESAKLTPQIMVLLVLAGFKRHWKWSLPMGLVLGLLAAGVLNVALPIQYEAKAAIQIRAITPQFLREGRQVGKYDEFVNTQLAYMRSPRVVDKVLESGDVAKLPVVIKQKDKRGWLTSRLRVKPDGKSEIVSVSFSTDTQEASERIVNAVVDAYFKFIEEDERQTAMSMVSGLQQEKRLQLANAARLQESIRTKTRQITGRGAVAGRDEILGGLAQGESLHRDLLNAQAQLVALGAKLKAVQGRIDQPGKVPFPVIAQLHPEFAALNAQRELLLQNRDRLLQTLSNENDPRIVQVNRQITSIEERMSAFSGDSAAGGGPIAEALQAREIVSAWMIEQEIQEKEVLVEELKNKYAEQLVNAAERSEGAADVSFDRTQLNRVDSALNTIEDRILNTQTEQRAPARITPLTRATLTEPSWKRQLMVVGMGAAAFAFAPLFLGIAIERMKPRLYHVSQVRRAIPQVLIGEIMEPPVSWLQGATFRRRLARYRESVHNWCTHLLLSEPFRTCRTLSVASVAGDDGKTFLAVQIAAAMAQMKTDGPVLLIDGDMRVGRLHLLFGNEEPGVGLADVLAFRNGPGEAIVESEKEPNLSLVSAGQLDTTPYELLGDGRFRELLDTYEQRFSLIIVVLPPVANAAESLIMAASTDSTLLCVRQKETVLAAMEDVYRKLVNTGAAVDGIVVKDIPYYQMAGRDGGFADKLEQIRLSHLLQYAD